MVAVIIEGGRVREVLSDDAGDALVIDLDAQGALESGLWPASLPDGERVLARVEALKMNVNPLFISALKRQLSGAKN